MSTRRSQQQMVCILAAALTLEMRNRDALADLTYLHPQGSSEKATKPARL